MMGIVNELQSSAESEDVLTVLRKAQRVASKLNRSDISEWISREQGGYPAEADVPPYRNVAVSFAYNTNGPVPAGFGFVRQGIGSLGDMGLKCQYPVRESIGAVNSWIQGLDRDKKGGLYMEVGDRFAETLKSLLSSNIPGLLDRFTYLQRLDAATIRDIPNRVKDYILDWACKLEAAGVHGEGQTFSRQEQANAQNISLYYMPNHSTTTQQGAFQINSPHATQHATVSINPVVAESLDKIRELVNGSNEIDDVDKQDINASIDLVRDLASKPTTEKTKLKINEKLSAIVSLLTIGSAVKPYIEHYVGIIGDAIRNIGS